MSGEVHVLYNASPATLTDGAQAQLQGDATGALKVAGAGTAGSPAGGVQSVQGVSGGVAQDQGTLGTFTTLTRPANATPYSINDSISDNATAGSVTALVATVATKNDAPMVITHINVVTTDTGLGNGTSVRAYLYNSDPTASSGVVGGDNAAFSNKAAGRIATFTGTFLAASDGGVAHLGSENTGPPIVYPASGARTLWIQFQALTAFTPSANSTTLIATAYGSQLRA